MPTTGTNSSCRDKKLSCLLGLKPKNLFLSMLVLASSSVCHLTRMRNMSDHLAKELRHTEQPSRMSVETQSAPAHGYSMITNPTVSQARLSVFGTQPRWRHYHLSQLHPQV